MPKSKALNDTPKVDTYMRDLEHPLKPVIDAVRGIILGAHADITEGIKWNSPSFYYKGDMVVFHTRSPEHLLLVFPNGIVINDTTGLLEGDYVDRRMAYFRSIDDVKAKKAALENAIRAWVRYMDGQE